MKEYKRLTDKTKTELLLDCHSCPYCGVEYLYDCHIKVSNRLAELEDKIEDGTLIELPCKVGDTVYCIYHFDDVWVKDCEYEIIPEEVVDIIVEEDDFDIGTACHMIGKFQKVCVCLTKAEAEAKLKELGNE